MALTQHVLATLSSLFWAVMLIISLKYVWIVLRFSNEGEGGVLALTALAHRVTAKSRNCPGGDCRGYFCRGAVLWRCSYHSAISVLSAIEG